MLNMWLYFYYYIIFYITLKLTFSVTCLPSDPFNHTSGTLLRRRTSFRPDRVVPRTDSVDIAEEAAAGTGLEL